MTHNQAAVEKVRALRSSQLDLYPQLQGTLNEVSDEMLGNTTWRTDQVDRSLRELMDSLVEHFGEQEKDL